MIDLNEQKNKILEMVESLSVWMDIAKLKPINTKIKQEMIDNTADCIEGVGFCAPIIADQENNMILAGHLRYLAALQLNLETVPVRYVQISCNDINRFTNHLYEGSITSLAAFTNYALENWAIEINDCYNFENIEHFFKLFIDFEECQDLPN